MNNNKTKKNDENKVQELNLYCKYCSGRLRKLSYVPAKRHMYHKKCYLDGIRWEAMKRDMDKDRAEGKVHEFPPVISQNIERGICIAHGLPANFLQSSSDSSMP